ncbi:MAG: respiratory nitrate reductase subunit gamma [Candidatus Krumholzibacteriia bacterium]
MGLLQLVVYACVLVFLVAVSVKIARYASAPVHMRWELYPVAHEKGRHHYGGSIFEEPDWWEKPRQLDHANEIREMGQEIFLLKGVRLNNPRLWLWSWPFHGGLYLVIGWMALLVVGGIMQLAGARFDGGVPALVRGVTLVVGYAGMALTAVGALGLFLHRTRNGDMRRFNTPADYLHLLWFAAAGVYGVAAFGAVDPGFDRLRAFTAGVIGFREAVPLPAATGVAVALGMLLVAYIPFTRMVHFAAKYFLYHEVRWSDEPLRKGSALESRIKQALNYGVSWRGPHIQTGQTWGQVATAGPADEAATEEKR